MTKQQFRLRFSSRKAIWLAVLGLIVILFGLEVSTLTDEIRQASGVRRLLQAGSSYSMEDLANPFICLRSTSNVIEAEDALSKIHDRYLQSVALCQKGERSAGLEMLKQEQGHSGANVQYAAALSVDDPNAGIEVLEQSNITDHMVVAIIQNIIARPDIDQYPSLRYLAKRVPDLTGTWTAWLVGAERYEAASQWVDAVNWIKEGASIAPVNVRGSLYLNLGLIYQIESEPIDYQTALSFYNLAIEQGGWIYPADEARAHWYRGEIYRILKEDYGPYLAIGEFKSAMEIQADNFWPLLELGNTYQFDLLDTDTAETYYKQVLSVNDQYPYAYFFIGEIYETRGDMGTARDWYQKALDQAPDYQPALDRIKALEGK